MPKPALYAACAVLGAALAAAQAPAQEGGFEDVEVEATPLGGGIHMLAGRGGNIGLSLGPDGSFLVDDQYSPLTPKILATVERLGGGPVRFVLNTHWHGDHTGGNENLAEAGAYVVAHENVRARMSTAQEMALRGRTVPPSPAGALPVMTFDASVTFHWNDEAIHVEHVAPAHTDGDAIVHFQGADVLHLGDVFFNGFYPFIDVDSGGSLDGTIAAAERGLALAGPDTRIIPGHGPLATRADLGRYRDVLVTVRDRVAALIAAGKSADEAVAATPTADLDAEWGQGFVPPDRFVRLVHASLSRP